MTAVSNPFIPLQVNSASDEEALGLKMWVGEVAGAYFRASVTEGRFPFKSLSGGATQAQWIVSARTTASYFERGANILEDADGDGADYLKDLNTAEVVVQVDRPLTSAHILDRQDSILTHFDTQAELRVQSGETIARRVDRNRLICIARGSHRHEDNGTDANDGVFVTGVKAGANAVTALEDADFASNAASCEATIALMAERFDNLENPKEGRMMFVPPSLYWFILQNLDDYIDRDFGGMGSKAMGEVFMIHGWEIIKTTNMPSGTITNPTGLSGGTLSNKYAVKATGLQALFATRDALAEVRLASGFGAESSYFPERMGTMVNTYWTGGIKELRPEACGSVYTSIPSDPND